MSDDVLTLSQALENQVLDGDTRVLGRIFKVPVTLTPDLRTFLQQAVENSKRSGSVRLAIEETLQAAARSARALTEALRVSFRVRLTISDGSVREVDLMAALVSPRGGGPAVKIGLPGDFLPKRKFVVRANCEYSITVDAVDESDALQRADVIPLKEWDTAWSEHEAEAESEVCDECRSYGPRANCDCRR